MSQESVVQGFLSSMSSVVDALQLPPEQVPAVVPTPPAQEGAPPHGPVLSAGVTCPVVASQLAAVHGFMSSMVVVTDPLQPPAEQVPAVVPMPPLQEAAPHDTVLLACVTCPVFGSQVSVVQTLP